jgi:hypothetical protein
MDTQRHRGGELRERLNKEGLRENEGGETREKDEADASTPGKGRAVSKMGRIHGHPSMWA